MCVCVCLGVCMPVCVGVCVCVCVCVSVCVVRPTGGCGGKRVIYIEGLYIKGLNILV